jgi:Fe-S cluster biogenesis protein NfuA
MKDISVFYEATPNPQSMKFIVTAMISQESVNITSSAEAARSPLAQKIMGFPWASGIFIGPHFVTVTKQEWVDWDIIAEPLSEMIKEHFNTGGVALLAPVASEPDSDQNADLPDDSAIVRQIKQILRDEIRPAVAQDGGDIAFDRYEEGRVYLQMQGACSGCPSSAYTLKEGIETRLREAIPEIQEVVSA